MQLRFSSFAYTIIFFASILGLHAFLRSAAADDYLPDPDGTEGIVLCKPKQTGGLTVQPWQDQQDGECTRTIDLYSKLKALCGDNLFSVTHKVMSDIQNTTFIYPFHDTKVGSQYIPYDPNWEWTDEPLSEIIDGVGQLAGFSMKSKPLVTSISTEISRRNLPAINISSIMCGMLIMEKQKQLISYTKIEGRYADLSPVDCNTTGTAYDYAISEADAKSVPCQQMTEIFVKKVTAEPDCKE